MEHIFPESLGNTEKILPKGVVCDTCNNGILASIDNSLLEFDLISFFRTFYGVKSKSGNIPPAKFNTMNMTHTGDNHVHVEIDSMSKKYFEKTSQGFMLHWKGKRKMTPKVLKSVARALYKICLELLYLDHGHEFACSKRFDEVREIILGKKDFHGYLVVSTHPGATSAGMSYRFSEGNNNKESLLIFSFRFMMLQIEFDMEQRVLPYIDELRKTGVTVMEF